RAAFRPELELAPVVSERAIVPQVELGRERQAQARARRAAQVEPRVAALELVAVRGLLAEPQPRAAREAAHALDRADRRRAELRRARELPPGERGVVERGLVELPVRDVRS